MTDPAPSASAGDPTAVVFRALAAVAGVASLVVTAGFLAGWAPVTSLWPFIAEETRLGHLFLASIAIAIAMPVLWVAASGSLRSAAAGALDLAVMFGAMAAYLLSLERPGLVDDGVGSAVAAVAMLGVFAYTQRRPWSDPRPMPRLVWVAFVVFAVVLTVVGTQLVRQTPGIFPWPLAPESSVMYGFIFYGAAVYFLVGAIERRRAAATGQLLGFLAYDLVLIGPFLWRFGEVPPTHLPSLVVYTGVVVVSGILAVFYLSQEVGRLWPRAPATTCPGSS